jgi:hypothetical protein
MDKNDRQMHNSDRHSEDKQDLPVELQMLAQRYATLPEPHSTPATMQRLMARLLLEETIVVRTTLQPRRSIVQTLRVARWQLRILSIWFWITSILLLALGFILAPDMPKNEIVAMLIFLLPLTTILSVVYTLNILSPKLRDVIASCPTNIVEITAGAAMAIVCFDGLLGLLATATLAALHWAPFGPLLVSWLGPLLLLVGLSFPVALRWGTLPAMVVGGAPWLLLVGATRLFPSSLLSQFLLGEQGSLSISAHVFAAGLGALILLLLLAYGSTWQRALIR